MQVAKLQNFVIEAAQIGGTNSQEKSMHNPRYKSYIPSSQKSEWIAVFLNWWLKTVNPLLVSTRMSIYRTIAYFS